MPNMEHTNPLFLILVGNIIFKLDLWAMFAEEMLIKGKDVIVEEICNYIRDDLTSIQRRLY